MSRKCIAVLLVLSASAGSQPSAQYAVEYNNLGIQAYEGGKFREAIGYFEKAHEGARDSAVVRRNLCNARQGLANELAKEGNHAEAAKHLELAISIDPENALPLVQLGSYYLQMDRVSDAIFRLEEAIEIQPGILDGHELLGEAYYRDNDIPSARAQWEYVLEMDPKRKRLRERYEKAFREESVEQDFDRGGSRHFKLSYPQGIPYPLRSHVLTVLERARIDVGRKFGGAYPPPPTQVIVYDAQQFSEATLLNGHVGAVYDGKIRCPLTEANGELLSDAELERRLTHEYVHVVVRHLVGDKVPWWLNEGLAETFSRDLDAAELQLLQRAYAEGVAFRLAELEAHQLQKLDPEVLRLAYAQSHATVTVLWTRFGQRRLTQLMTDLGQGIAPEDALQRSYHRSYAALEAEVAGTYR